MNFIKAILNFLKTIVVFVSQTLLSTAILFFVIETAFYFLDFPTGASRFVEAITIREEITMDKPEDEFWIFTYGESTMHGAHYWPASSPARWMEVYLKDFLPDKKIKVVNFARMGQGAEFIYGSLRDTVQYKPDLAIFYIGHNAFLPGNRVDQVKAEKSEPKAIARELIRKSRFISAVYRYVINARIQLKKDVPQDRIEQEVIETTPGSALGPENAAPRNEDYYKENIQFFRERLFEMVRLVQRNEIPVLFFRPVGNLKDFAPFGSKHMKKLEPEALKWWNEWFRLGSQAQDKGDLEKALKYYQKAYEIDDTYAELSFRMGKIQFKFENFQEAKRLFVEAKDNDTIIVRATQEILELFEELQKVRNVRVIDTEKLLIDEAPGKILGEPIVEDNVHFSVKGHSLLGKALAEEIANQGWLGPKEEWQFDRERSFEEVSDDLGVTPDLIFSADLKMVSYFGTRYDNRVRFAQKALSIYPEDPKALRHLAWSYWVMGKRSEALKVYQKMSEVAPDALEIAFQHQPEIERAFLRVSKN